MNHNLHLINTLSRQKEKFEPINPPFVGMYLCGPTVYGEPHLGHTRGVITFDVLFRYLTHVGYRVRYVRNITDVGHLENDGDEGEDKIAKKARLEQLEPMEIAKLYTDIYQQKMSQINALKPSIEPLASGHIPEQIELIEEILAHGLAYVANGSVYFDTLKYNQTYQDYGKLSGRIIEDLVAGEQGRTLDAQDDKQNPIDFALWKKAKPEHIMQWKSPWGMGFPGWHLECSAMSKKYLGKIFDIHGGGMDLMFPHHECEIAQAKAAGNPNPVNYWLHNNMITIESRKMGKSLGNFITLDQLFEGKHPLLEQAYSPMTLRFFVLQAHYRSTLDFSNDALKAAETGYKRLMKALKTIEKIPSPKPNATNSFDLETLINKTYKAIDDDLNTPIIIANLFEIVHQINLLNDNKATLSQQSLQRLKQHLFTFTNDILGLTDETPTKNSQTLNQTIDLIIELRNDARKAKDFETSDKIRQKLTQIGIEINDTKEGATWNI